MPTRTGTFGPHSSRGSAACRRHCTQQVRERNGVACQIPLRSTLGRSRRTERRISVYLPVCLRLTPHSLVLPWVRPALSPPPSVGVGKRNVLPSPLAQAQVLVPFVAQVRWRLASCIS